MATILGSTSADNLTGTSDDDLINGLEGNDTLDGGGGTDTLYGEDGDNTYIFTGGNLTINNVDSGGVNEDNGLGDTLLLSALNASDVTFSRDSTNSDDLLISVNGSTDSIVVKYYFNGSLLSAEAVETIVFADSSTVSSTQINALIGGSNSAPVANDDSANTTMFTPLTVNVLANDYDPESDSFDITGINSTTTLGTFTLNGDSTITFTPDGSSTGTAEVTYTIQDSAGNSAQAVLSIAVSDGSNVAPVASDDTEFAHLSPVTVDVLGNDSDADNDTLSVTAVNSTSSLGSFVLNGDNTVTFTPNGSGTGDAVATYSLSDGNGHTAQADLTVTVSNAAPVTSDDNANAHLSAVIVDVLANDVDGDSDTLSVTAINSTSSLGAFVLNGDNTVTFTPNGSATGDAIATYTVTDSFGSSSQAQLTVTVGNQAPVLADDVASAYLAPVTVAVLANDTDIDSDSLSVSAVDSTSTLGAFVVNGDNTITFTANGSGSGDAVATYTVIDSFGASSQAQLTVTVSDTALGLTDDHASTTEDAPVTVDVLANDTSFSGEVLSVTAISSTSSLGTFVVNSDSSVTFNPNGSGSGDAIASYTVQDASGNTSQATLTVSVTSSDLTLTGTASADTLNGGSGADSIDGLAGNDMLSGLAGADTLKGGAGADKLYGGNDNDTLYAGAPINLISNGSFESGDLSGWSAYAYNASASISVETGTTTPVTALTIAAPTDGSYHAVFDEDDIAAHALIQTITAPTGAASLMLSFDLYGDNQAGDSAYNGSFDVTGVNAEQFVRIDLLTASANAWDLGAGVVVNLYQGLISNPTDEHFSFELLPYVTAGQSYQLRFSQASNQYFQTVALDNVQLLASANDEAIDSLLGGNGDDSYVVDSATDKIIEWAGAGTDSVWANTSYTLSDNVENLTLGGISASNGTGNNLDNQMNGNGANNNLQGKLGNDTLSGGAGNDMLVGGAGDDLLDGGAGTDTVNYYNTGTGGVQVDLSTGIATGADGTDALIRIENISGSAYDDTLIGNDDNNTLVGAQGNDTLTGGVGADIVAGGVGDDVLSGDAGNDYLTGGAGDDQLNGGTGTDTANYGTASGSIQADLSTGTTSGADGSDTFISIENISGSAYDDTLTGDAANNTLVGAQGNDTLAGGFGADSLAGGKGNDVLTGDAGNDTLIGGIGDDSLDGGVGTDTASYSTASSRVQVDLSMGTSSGADGSDTLTSIENISGSAYNDTLTGNEGNNVLTGLQGKDTLTGGAGLDTLLGGAGDDILDGGLGFDTASYSTAKGSVQVNLATGSVSGADGTDTLISIESIIGSAYGDTLVGSSGNNTLAGGAGNDTLTGGFGNDNLVGGAGADVLNGGYGQDTISYSSASGNVQIDLSTGSVGGADGTDTLISIESITGSAYGDTLVGTSGNNTLAGGAGNDTLTGGEGNDNLIGGVGDDSYNIGLGFGIDRIIDVDGTLGNVDTFALDGTVAYDQLWFRQVDNNLEVSIIGTTNIATISGWYADTANHVELFTASGKTLTDSNVENLVTAMAALTPPALGETTLSTAYQDELNSVLAANWS